VLKARVVDSNKAVQSLALDIVARIATGMGTPFDKYTRFYTVPVTSVLSDQKAPARAAALQTLTAMATACESLDSMLSDLGKALEVQNPVQRATLLPWLGDWLKDHPNDVSADLRPWAVSIVSCLDDRSGDVRKGAQAVLPFLIAGAGYDYVVKQADSLKPASKKTAVPLIQAAHATARAAAPASAPAPAKTKASAAKAAPAAAAPARAMVSPEQREEEALSVAVVAPARMKLPLGIIKRPEVAPPAAEEAPRARLGVGKPAANGVRRVLSAAAPRPTPPESPTVTAGLIFTTVSTDPKRGRLAKDSQRWINESGTTRKDLADLLQHQMEPHASRELVGLLFSHDHNAVNDHVAGMSMMVDLFTNADGEDVRAVCLANADLPLKYASIKAHEPQSNVATKCLDVVEAVLSLMRSADYQLSEPEAMAFIPTLVYKVILHLFLKESYLINHIARGCQRTAPGTCPGHHADTSEGVCLQPSVPHPTRIWAEVKGCQDEAGRSRRAS
jgi:cytoskeleton-associated protein 5